MYSSCPQDITSALNTTPGCKMMLTVLPAVSFVQGANTQAQINVYGQELRWTSQKKTYFSNPKITFYGPDLSVFFSLRVPAECKREFNGKKRWHEWMKWSMLEYI